MIGILLDGNDWLIAYKPVYHFTLFEIFYKVFRW